MFRAAEADVRVRQLAGWREDLEAPAPDARHAVTLAIKQDRAAILAALATTSDPDSPQYGQHYTLEEVAAISTPKRSSTNVRAFVEKAASAMGAVSVAWSPGGDFVRLEARVEDLDKIFNAKFRRWERVLRGEVVHETYRTRELAVPKDLEAHLDGFLGALHLPSGQLLRRRVGRRRSGPSVGRRFDRRSDHKLRRRRRRSISSGPIPSRTLRSVTRTSRRAVRSRRRRRTAASVRRRQRRSPPASPPTANRREPREEDRLRPSVPRAASRRARTATARRCASASPPARARLRARLGAARGAGARGRGERWREGRLTYPEGVPRQGERQRPGGRLGVRADGNRPGGVCACAASGTWKIPPRTARWTRRCRARGRPRSTCTSRRLAQKTERRRYANSARAKMRGRRGRASANPEEARRGGRGGRRGRRDRRRRVIRRVIYVLLASRFVLGEARRGVQGCRAQAPQSGKERGRAASWRTRPTRCSRSWTTRCAR